jgi:hypothetical protein
LDVVVFLDVVVLLGRSTGYRLVSDLVSIQFVPPGDLLRCLSTASLKAPSFGRSPLLDTAQPPSLLRANATLPVFGMH